MRRRTSYITTSIPYVNGRAHAGHALEYAQADAFARYRRQVGDATRLQTGSDDNSLKNVLAAQREGIAVAALVERNARGFRDLADELGVGYDGFIRTSADPEHRRGVTALWRACDAAGAIYRRTYRGLYCVGCEQFYTEDELTPEGLCPEHLTRPEVVEEENYFFRLSHYASALQELIESGALRVVPEGRRNEVLSFIARGLEDFSISRSQERARGWGIPVPDDPSQVMYVWFDALGNYITALGYGGAADQSDGGADDSAYQTFWAGADERVHVIGKGILRFHAVYWPAMLLAAGLPAPTAVFVHGYLTVEGQKISKSLENAADPRDIIAAYGAEALRWYLLREIHPTADGDFSVARLVARYNTDLANDLGNLLNRANAMLHRYRGGVVPAPGVPQESPDGNHEAGATPGTEGTHPGILPAQQSQPQAGAPSPTVQPIIHDLATLAEALPERIAASMNAYDPRAALEAAWELVTRANRAVDETAPWALHRAEKEGDASAAASLDAVLYALLEAVRLAAVHLEPFLPASSARILSQINAPDDAQRPYAERVRWGGLPAATTTGKPTPVFPRLDVGNVER